ncbi:DUF4334 domain-containing protein [Nocardia sp. NPDC005366]|uniref:DUF4334 domain-containing protein n=1 Tax=Nocardia sp. NPDC005366 TaxID=3156878 RepID=UPI0033B8B1E9
MTTNSATEELAQLQADGCTREQAWALFDGLPVAKVADIATGRWRGSEIRTGHPFDGVLGASGWYGKQFDDAESVHPLLFSDTAGKIFAVDPRRVPLSLTGKVPLPTVRAIQKSLRYTGIALRTTRYAARLRAVEYRDVVSAAMIYDHLPIIDHFRQVDADTLFGVMDMRGLAEPYFFILRR